MEYLHNHRRPPIVHMNITPENILLDGALDPKISGFGLARLYVEEDQYTSIKVTSPYMAPELVSGTLTIKSDVYSFGIILLEIVSWRKNVTWKAGQEAYILHKRGELGYIIDKNLDAYDHRQALTILELAVKCTHISHSVRPSMSEVVSVLLNKMTMEELSVSAAPDVKCAGDLAHADNSMPSTSSSSTETKYELDSISVDIPTKS